ncbi:MAG: phytanoyl-CoA dioxygenase family protein [Candidatus Latescibacteria bacterium]|jgi:ectoine hydroxylase-related dioxygenase (phytanoyl-CoA dioxygenase family)|nr:phytanoyl-CoA dioxygenase family protein [Candidatus Latescibacterota bacterium]
MTASVPTTYELSAEQKYRFDLQGYIVLEGHYDASAIEELHVGIDELQAIPVEHEAYSKLGVASYALAAAMNDPQHPVWNGDHRIDRVHPETGTVGRVDHALCGTDKFDLIVRDPILKAIHTTLAGGDVFISATYFIEKVGPVKGGGLHNGGFPVDRDIYYAYDHTHQRFACSSTKSVVILSDMTKIESGPFAAIPGSHKANFACPFDMSDASENPMAVPVFAAPGDVIIFSEGMTHNAFPVTDHSTRRSVFFCYMPAIGRNNLPDHRMSIYPDHVLERLPDQAELLTSPGYI